MTWGQTPKEAFSHGVTETRSGGTGPVTGVVFSRRDATAAEEKEWGQALVRFCARPHTERNSRRGQLPISEPNTSVT